MIVFLGNAGSVDTTGNQCQTVSAPTLVSCHTDVDKTCAVGEIAYGVVFGIVQCDVSAVRENLAHVSFLSPMADCARSAGRKQKKAQHDGYALLHLSHQ